MIHFSNKFKAAVLVAVLGFGAGIGQAAPVNYNVSGAVDFGPLLGETYTGKFSFDDAPLTGSGNEFLSVDYLDFNFLGNAFNQTNGVVLPEAAFLDGDFLGLSFSGLSFNVNASNPNFAFIPGFFNISEAFFSYDNRAGGAGFGSLVYTVSAVPEPQTWAMLLSGLALVGVVVRRRREV